MTALRNVRLHFLPVCLSSWASIVLGTLQSVSCSSFLLLPLPLFSPSPLDDAVIKGLARLLAGTLKSPAANDKVFVLIALGTTERHREEGEVLAAVVRGLRGAIAGCTVGWRPEGSEGKKCFENIIHIRRHRHKIVLLRGKSSTMSPSGISSFRVNCKCMAQ